LKAYELQGPGGVDAMMLVEKPVPAPGPGQVLVKLKAVTINYRDLLTVKGGYGSRQKFPLVPLSDGAGVVESVGAGVTSFKAGDRVTGSFFEGWLGGEPSEEKMRSNLGGALDGVLCGYRVWPAAALVRTPDHLSGALRPGNVHSADGWGDVLKPVVARYQSKVLRVYFRACGVRHAGGLRVSRSRADQVCDPYSNQSGSPG
jgi:Alcohol dehydrogenase GroES-like domain